MQRQLYPAPCAEDSLEAHLSRHPSGSHAFYGCVVAAVLAAGGALPCVTVRLSVRGSGIIRPVIEKQDIRSHVAGVVDRMPAWENEPVRTGDTIAVFRSSAVDERAALLAARLARKARLARDLAVLARGGAAPAERRPRLETADYRREYDQFASELRANRIARERAERVLRRTRALRARRFASASDLEDARSRVASTTADGALIVRRYRSRWQSALTTLRAEMAELASQREQARQERARYIVRAPIAGTLEQVASLSPGSYVQAGERLAVVSPGAALVAKVFVAPRDIGLVRRGAPVRLLVDAFDYTEWGVVAGRVRAISSDFVQVDGRPMFEVTCTLAEHRLTLPNGAVGELRKGMTLQARFLIARRTLLQLLSDHVGDWLDPGRAPAAGRGSAT